MQRRLATWLGLALSVGLLVYIGLHFDIVRALEKIGLADPVWSGAATLAYCLLFPLRGLRWSVLLRPVKHIRWESTSEVFVVGFMANNILPARLGDVARAFVLARREKIGATTSFSNIMLERVFDGLTVVGMLGLVLLLEPPPSHVVIGTFDVVSAGTITVALAFAGALFVSMLVAWQEERALALAAFFLRPLPPTFGEKVLGLLRRLGQGLHTLKRPRETAIVVALSIVIWCLEVGVYWVLQHAFGLHLSYLGLTLVMATLSLGVMLPSAPGFVGLYELLVIGALGVYGVKEPLAPAFAITLHLIHYIPGTLLGLFFTWKSGLKLREIRTADRKVDDPSDPPGSAALRENEAPAAPNQTPSPEMELS